MWEHFTTKPLVDKGIFKHLGDFPTPWSSFVIAATDVFIADQKESISAFYRFSMRLPPNSNKLRKSKNWLLKITIKRQKMYTSGSH